MQLSKKSGYNLYCFTPEVALATFIIEVLLAGYVLFRYGLNKFTQIAVLTLLFLGGFQFTEYMICSGGDPVFWSRAGVVSITLLPVLGFHLVSMMISYKTKLISLGYALGGLIIGWVLFLGVPIIPECTGKFVVLKFTTLFDILFNLYYAVYVLLAVFVILMKLVSPKGKKHGLFWMLMTYLSFLIPTTLVYIFIAVSRQAMPSIMCGFAILGALVLVFKVFPKIKSRGERN